MRTHPPTFRNRNGYSYLDTWPRCSTWGRSYQMGLIVPLTQMSPDAVTRNTAPVIRPTNAGPSGTFCTTCHSIWSVLTHGRISHKSFSLNDLPYSAGAASELHRCSTQVTASIRGFSKGRFRWQVISQRHTTVHAHAIGPRAIGHDSRCVARRSQTVSRRNCFSVRSNPSPTHSRQRIPIRRAMPCA